MNNATSTANPPVTDFQLKKYIGMVGASFAQLHNHPALAWITPQLPVRLIEADGSQSLWVGGRKQQAAEAALQSARFTAVELPADLALSRSLVLPPLSERDLRDALALEVRDSSPFDPSELVWGYRRAVGAAGQLKVTTALASRRQVTQYLQDAAPELADSASLEVWVMTDEGAPVVLQGFGEAARARHASQPASPDSMRRSGGICESLLARSASTLRPSGSQLSAGSCRPCTAARSLSSNSGVQSLASTRSQQPINSS